MSVCLYVCPSGTKLSEALNLHLSLSGLPQVYLRSILGLTQGLFKLFSSLRRIDGAENTSSCFLKIFISTRRVILEVKFEQFMNLYLLFTLISNSNRYSCVSILSSESIFPVGIVSRHPVSGVSHCPGSQVCLLVPKLGLKING